MPNRKISGAEIPALFEQAADCWLMKCLRDGLRYVRPEPAASEITGDFVILRATNHGELGRFDIRRQVLVEEKPKAFLGSFQKR